MTIRTLQVLSHLHFNKSLSEVDILNVSHVQAKNYYQSSIDTGLVLSKD